MGKTFDPSKPEDYIKSFKIKRSDMSEAMMHAPGVHIVPSIRQRRLDRCDRRVT